MAALLVPNQGATGVIKLKAPFASLCTDGVPYTVTSISTLGAITAAGQDPYGLFYEPYQITTDDYLKDVAAGACILSFQSPTGETVNAPNSYLLSLPVATGIPYVTMMVGVNLGTVPVDLNLAYFISQMQSLANDLLGVANADVRAVKGSTVTYLSVEDSNAIEAARANVMSAVVTDRAKLVASEAARVKLQQYNQDLEAYILANIPPGTTPPPTP
jgi:hypothetical protein